MHMPSPEAGLLTLFTLFELALVHAFAPQFGSTQIAVPQVFPSTSCPPSPWIASGQKRENAVASVRWMVKDWSHPLFPEETEDKASCEICSQRVEDCKCPRKQELLQRSSNQDVPYKDVPTQSVGLKSFGRGFAPVQTFFPHNSRVIAVGDIHGDERALIAVLRMANCVDADGKWCGGTAHVVQIGDVLDRGHEERDCLDKLFQLKHQAAAAGGAVHVLLGNHEIMNVDQDFDFVGLGGYDGWESDEEDHGNPVSFLSSILDNVVDSIASRGVPHMLQDRSAAFTVGTGFGALMLSEMPLAIQIGDSVFVHGGLEPCLLSADLSLHDLNVATNAWLRGLAPRPSAAFIDADDSLIWSRAFSTPPDRPLRESDARRLEHVLWHLGARRMVVGHTPQAGGINCCSTRNGYEVWRTDTGMSRWVKGGQPECLELLPDGSAHVISQAGAVPAVVRKMEEGAEFVPPKRANSGAGKRGYVTGAVGG